MHQSCILRGERGIPEALQGFGGGIVQICTKRNHILQLSYKPVRDSSIRLNCGYFIPFVSL